MIGLLADSGGVSLSFFEYSNRPYRAIDLPGAVPFSSAERPLGRARTRAGRWIIQSSVDLWVNS